MKAEYADYLDSWWEFTAEEHALGMRRVNALAALTRRDGGLVLPEDDAAIKDAEVLGVKRRGHKAQLEEGEHE